MKKTRGTCQIENRPEALHDWVLKLIEEFGARGSIYIATEKARGALLYTLMQYPQLTLFPLNSKATGKLREALRAGGAKNDRWDCRLQAGLVKHFYHLLPVWRPDDVLTRKLAALCEGRQHPVLAWARKSKPDSKLPSPSPSNCLRATAKAS